MSRLYYEKKETEFSFRSFMRSSGDAPKDGAPSQAGKTAAIHLEKVAKLVPSEVIAGYLIMFGFVSEVGSASLQSLIPWLVFLFGVVLTPIYLWNVADANKPRRNHLIVSTIAFVVWAYVTTGEQLMATINPDLFDKAIGSILLVAFSLVSAVVPLDK